MHKFIILFILLAAPGPANAQDKNIWTTDDTLLLTAAIAVTAADWAQTLHMARNPDRYKENNPIVSGIVGEHPSEGRVNALIGTTVICSSLFARLLSKPYRTYWLSLWITTEAAVVRHTHKEVGIKIAVHF